MSSRISVLLRSEESHKHVCTMAVICHQKGNQHISPQQFIKICEMIGSVSIFFALRLWQWTHELIDHKPAVASKELGQKAGFQSLSAMFEIIRQSDVRNFVSYGFAFHFRLLPNYKFSNHAFDLVVGVASMRWWRAVRKKASDNFWSVVIACTTCFEFLKSLVNNVRNELSVHISQKESKQKTSEKTKKCVSMMHKSHFFCKFRVYHKEAHVIVKNVEHQFLNLSDEHDFGSTDLRKRRQKIWRARLGIVIIPDDEKSD